MKEKIAKLIDLKSIITLILVLALVFLVVYCTVNSIDVTSNIFLLFSNTMTMIITYFFTKKNGNGGNDGLSVC